MHVHTNVNLLPSALNERLLAVFDAGLRDLFPAFGVAAFLGGTLVLDIAGGVIDPAAGQGVVTPTTRFDLASLTKPFTATTFLALVSRGVVKLDDPLISAIPEFGSAMRAPERITFRHLLTHTAGLPPWGAIYHAEAQPAPPPPDQPDPVTRGERWTRALATICAYPFDNDAGDGVRYSDLGFVLLGEAIARLWYAGSDAPMRAHLGLDMVICEGICERLALESPCFNPAQNGIDRMTIAPTEDDQSWRRRRVWGEVHDENADAVGGVAGHAGLFAAAGDVAAFGQAWLSRDPQLRVAADLMDQAVSEQAASDTDRRGWGWLLRLPEGSSAGEKFSPRSYGHTGFTGTSLWIDPERALVVALLTNRVYGGRASDGIHEFRRAVHDVLADI
ncbi:MAG: beta-lactamase family protein [Anaerolineae bacterium]|nr:beta-lactamase family protein [Anaerolineae bacterium]